MALLGVLCNQWEPHAVPITVLLIISVPITELENWNISSSILLHFQDFSQSYAYLDGSPGGGTPLCYHVNQVVEQITLMAPQLRATGEYIEFDWEGERRKSEGYADSI